MKRQFLMLLLIGVLLAQPLQARHTEPFHGLKFDALPTLWDEAIPLGNGIIGNLIWEKEGRLRIALDRADLGICVRSKSSNHPTIPTSSSATRSSTRKMSARFRHSLTTAAARTALPPKFL